MHPQVEGSGDGGGDGPLAGDAHGRGQGAPAVRPLHQCGDDTWRRRSGRCFIVGRRKRRGLGGGDAGDDEGQAIERCQRPQQREAGVRRQLRREGKGAQRRHRALEALLRMHVGDLHRLEPAGDVIGGGGEGMPPVRRVGCLFGHAAGEQFHRHPQTVEAHPEALEVRLGVGGFGNSRGECVPHPARAGFPAHRSPLPETAGRGAPPRTARADSSLPRPAYPSVVSTKALTAEGRHGERRTTAATREPWQKATSSSAASIRVGWRMVPTVATTMSARPSRCPSMP